jgi:hypothetical protein
VSRLTTPEGEAVDVLNVGQVGSDQGDKTTLATLGRCGDILVKGSHISKL